MAELFVVGTFWFFTLCLVELIVLLACVANEKGVAATLSVLAFGAMLQFGGGPNIAGFVIKNPLLICASVAAYFVIGVIWGYFKWRFFYKDQKALYKEERTKWLRQRRVVDPNTMPEELRNEWIAYVSDSWSKELKAWARTPVLAENKARFMRWMTFWWVSMAWAFVDDFVVRVFNTIYNQIHDRLQRMADAEFADVRAELTPIPKKDVMNTLS